VGSAAVVDDPADRHERLPDADTADAMKAYWRAALVVLKRQLE
jgi:hypothetical protein